MATLTPWEILIKILETNHLFGMAIGGYFSLQYFRPYQFSNLPRPVLADYILDLFPTLLIGVLRYHGLFLWSFFAAVAMSVFWIPFKIRVLGTREYAETAFGIIYREPPRRISVPRNGGESRGGRMGFWTKRVFGTYARPAMERGYESEEREVDERLAEFEDNERSRAQVDGDGLSEKGRVEVPRGLADMAREKSL